MAIHPIVVSDEIDGLTSIHPQSHATSMAKKAKMETHLGKVAMTCLGHKTQTLGLGLDFGHVSRDSPTFEACVLQDNDFVPPGDMSHKQRPT